MTTTTITAKVHKPLDVHGHLPTLITLDHIVIFNDLPDTGYLFATQIITVHLVRQISLVENFTGCSQADPIYIG
jgi:hypothetical protein